MNEIEVGEYIRFGYGEIGIVKYCDGINIGIITQYGETEISSGVDKIAKRPIDLIEVGDYVNGKKVLRINDYGDFKRADFNLDYDDGDAVYNDDIKTILTKEQYEQNRYKVVE